MENKDIEKMPPFNCEEIFGNNSQDCLGNVISLGETSKKCIISESTADANEHNEKEGDLFILNNLYKLSEDYTPKHYGRRGINRWLLKEEISKFPTFVFKFFKLKLHLNPFVFLFVFNLVYFLMASISQAKRKEIRNITEDDLSDPTVYQACLDKFNNKTAMFYLKKFFKFNNPFMEIDLSLKNETRLKLEHPFILKIVKELRKRNRKESSINSNVICRAKSFLSWVCSAYTEFKNYDVNNIPIWMLRKEHILDYRSFLIRQINRGEITELGAKRTLQNIKTIFFELFRLQMITQDIARGIPNIKADEYVFRDIPSEVELEKFFHSIEQYSDEPNTERLIFGLMAQLGFRSCEIVNLKWDGVNLSRKTVSFKGKGNKSHVLPIPDSLMLHFNCMHVQDKGPVFPKITTWKIYQNYLIYTKLAGWNYDGGPHLLRHTFCTKLAQKGVRPDVVRTFARHDDLLTTSKYIHSRHEELVCAVSKIKLIEE